MKFLLKRRSQKEEKKKFTGVTNKTNETQDKNFIPFKATPPSQYSFTCLKEANQLFDFSKKRFMMKPNVSGAESWQGKLFESKRSDSHSEFLHAQNKDSTAPSKRAFSLEHSFGHDLRRNSTDIFAPSTSFEQASSPDGLTLSYKLDSSGDETPNRDSVDYLSGASGFPRSSMLRFSSLAFRESPKSQRSEDNAETSPSSHSVVTFHGSQLGFSNVLATSKTMQTKYQSESFCDKIEACCEIFDFKVPDSRLDDKKNKQRILSDLIRLVDDTEYVFTHQMIGLLIQMISVNIFRPLPPPSENFVYITSAVDAEQTEPELESSWPHLRLVYELLLQSIVSSRMESKILEEYIDRKFVLKLLDLFSSEDPRERDYLKTILHRIYGKIMPLRSFIRKSIHHKFMLFLDHEESRGGISELLEILASIISGFARPLKKEHTIFLRTSLLPLHKACSLACFNQELTYCLAQYVERDRTLVVTIILGLLRYWPVTNTFKEVLFLSEIEELLEYTQPEDFAIIMFPLFRQLALCIQSPHFQVAERVLFMWNNECILKLINMNREKLYPILIAALCRNASNHWNSTVNMLTLNAMKVLSCLDSKLYESTSATINSLGDSDTLEKAKREKVWKELRKNYDQRMKNGQRQYES